ncbi:hypothetical protein ES708_23537 [subsurface metagenome]
MREAILVYLLTVSIVYIITGTPANFAAILPKTLAAGVCTCTISYLPFFIILYSSIIDLMFEIGFTFLSIFTNLKTYPFFSNVLASSPLEHAISTAYPSFSNFSIKGNNKYFTVISTAHTSKIFGNFSTSIYIIFH